MNNQEASSFDLSALDKTYSRQMFSQEVLQQANIPTEARLKFARSVYVWVLLGVPALIFLISIANSLDVGLSLIVAVIITIIMLVVMFATRSGRMSFQRDMGKGTDDALRYVALAQANGWSYKYLPNNLYDYDSVRVQQESAFYASNKIPQHLDSDSPELKALMLDEASGGRITSQLYMNEQMELVEYVISGDPAKRGMSVQNRLDINKAFLRLRFDKQIPHLFLDSKNNEERFVQEDYVKQALSLEGDFPDAFMLFAPTDYQIDALQIFTPDVMQAFLDCGRDFDYELIGNSLYIFVPTEVIRSSTGLAQLLGGARRLYEEVTKQLLTYKDDRVSAQTGGVAQPTTVAQQGTAMAENQTMVHLKRRISFLGWKLFTFIIAILFLVVIFIYVYITN